MRKNHFYENLFKTLREDVLELTQNEYNGAGMHGGRGRSVRRSEVGKSRWVSGTQQYLGPGPSWRFATFGGF